MIKRIVFGAGAALLPVIAFAQPDGDFGGIGETLKAVIEFINGILVPLVFAIAFLFFIWGVFKYFIQGGGDEAKQKEGKQLMLYAIVGFVLMVSVWGIVNVVAEGLGFRQQSVQGIPNVPNTR